MERYGFRRFSFSDILFETYYLFYKKGCVYLKKKQKKQAQTEPEASFICAHLCSSLPVRPFQKNAFLYFPKPVWLWT